MLSRTIVASLVILSLSAARLPVYSAGKSQAPQTSQASQIEDVKSQIKKINIGDPVTITLANGKTKSGYLTRIGDSEFELGTAVRDAYFTFRYAEVSRIDRGFDTGFRNIQSGDDPETPAPPAPPVLDARAEALRSRIQDLGAGEYVKITLRNGKKFNGLLTRVDDYDFEMSDQNRGAIFAFLYSDVKKVDRDSNRQKWLWVSVAAMSAGSIIGAILITRKGRDTRFPTPPF